MLSWLIARLKEPSSYLGIVAIATGVQKAATAASTGGFLMAAAELVGGAIGFCKAEGVAVPAAITEAAAILPAAK